MGADRTAAGLDRFVTVERLRRSEPLTPAEEVRRRGSEAVSVGSGGLGPIQPLLDDDTVDEIMINGPGPVWIERHGRLQPSGVTVDGYGAEVLAERVLAPAGLRADRTAPVVDARLDDGSRVSVVVAPLSAVGPLITIRKFAPHPVGLDQFGPPGLVTMLNALVEARASMVVVGPTSSGKTSLVGALLDRCPDDERVVVLEDTAELALTGANRVRLECRPPNREGVGEVTLRDLVVAAMRMRPDRLVVGEVRGPEAFDLALALTSGHAGSLTTCHASNSATALHRLEALARLAQPSAPVARFLHQALDAIIVMGRADGAARRVVEIRAVPDDPAEPLDVIWSGGRR